MDKKKIMNILLIVFPVAAVILTALPHCVQMQFASGPEQTVVEYCSGFSMLPVGYGNWSHMVTGILSGILAVLAAVRCFRESDRLNGWIRGLAAIAASAPVLASVLFHSMTAVSWTIAAVLLAQFALISYLRR